MTEDTLQGEDSKSEFQHPGQQPSSHMPRILLNSNSNSATNTPLRIKTPPMVRSPRTASQDNLPVDSTYKHIKVTKGESSVPPHLIKLVSFDTISDKDLEFVTNESSTSLPGSVRSGRRSQRDVYYDPDDNEIYPGESGMLRARSPLSLRTPSPSGQHLRRTFTRTDQLDGLQVNRDGFRTDYPSGGPMVLTTSMALRGSQMPLSHKRGSTWLVYITGRRHTWVALDFTISKLLKPGDTIVVISRIPLSNWKNPEGSKLQGKVDSEPIKRSAIRVKKYVQELMDPSLGATLAVDIYLADEFGEVLSQCISLYSPLGLVISHKPTAKFLDPTNWLKTRRLTHRLIKNYTLPIVVVPVLTSNKFEVDLFEELALQRNWTVNLGELRDTLERLDQAKSPVPDAQLDKLLQKRLKELAKQHSLERVSSGHSTGSSSAQDSEGADTDSVVSDVGSDDEYGVDYENDAYLRVTEVVKRKRDELRTHFEEAYQRPITPDWFLDNLVKVSDLTATVAHCMQESSKDSAAAELVRSLTFLPKLEKQKSMLDVLDDDDQSSTSAVNGLRKQITGAGSPSIKFQLDGNLKIKNASGSNSSVLRKTMSNTVDGPQRATSPLSNQFSNGLMPSRSHDAALLRSPGFARAKSESILSSTKPKKGSFFTRLLGKRS